MVENADDDGRKVIIKGRRVSFPPFLCLIETDANVSAIAMNTLDTCIEL